MSNSNKPATSMTLREYFASQAMKGMCSIKWTYQDDDDLDPRWARIARLSLEAADALLIELKKGER